MFYFLTAFTPHFVSPTVLAYLSPFPKRSEFGASCSAAELMGETAQQVREAVWRPAGRVRPIQEHGQVPQHLEQPEYAATHHSTVPSC